MSNSKIVSLVSVTPKKDGRKILGYNVGVIPNAELQSDGILIIGFSSFNAIPDRFFESKQAACAFANELCQKEDHIKHKSGRKSIDF